VKLGSGEILTWPRHSACHLYGGHVWTKVLDLTFTTTSPIQLVRDRVRESAGERGRVRESAGECGMSEGECGRVKDKVQESIWDKVGSGWSAG
jgi:hypothetical protein